MTNKYISAKGSVLLFGEESEYGTAVVPGRPIGVIQTWGYNETKGVSQVYGQGDSNMLYLNEGEYDVSGSLSVSLQRLEIIEYLLGAPVDEGSGPYTHTISKASESVKSITLGIGLYDANTESMLVRNRFKGVRIKKVEIQLSENKEAMLNIDWEGIGNDYDEALMVSANMANETIFNSKQWKFKIADTGTTPVHLETVTNATISFTRDVAKATGNGKNTPLFKDVDKFVSKITGNLFFADKKIYEDFQGSSTTVGMSQTVKDIIIELDNGLKTTKQRKAEFKFKNCIVSGGFRVNQPSTTSFVKIAFTYETFVDSIILTDNTADWNV